jgi:hypothetical protein
MQAFRRSVLAAIAVTVALSLSAAPKQPQQQKPQPQTQQQQSSKSPWLRFIRKIMDDVIPPPDNRFSIPPG